MSTIKIYLIQLPAMNTLLLSGLALLALATVEARIPCNAIPCDTAKCTVLTEDNCAGRIVPNGGICHCCDGCYTVLGKYGESLLLLVIKCPIWP